VSPILTLPLVEIHERGVERAAEAGQVGAVMDGAEWQQGFVDYHCPGAVRVLDFPHAAERLGGIANAVWGEGSVAGKEWLKERCHQLKHEGPACVLEQLRSLQQLHPTNQVLATNLAYLEKREAQMQYPRFQEEGWPIGSGVVESANKLVVEARLKGGGMHWEGSHVNPMLSLRNVVCNDRWAQAWPRIRSHQHQQAREGKAGKGKHQQVAQVVQSQVEAKIGSKPKMLPKHGPASLTPNKANNDENKPKAPWRPAADHPWRRSPIGRARFQSLKAS
jgi:hypothetical protein